MSQRKGLLIVVCLVIVCMSSVVLASWTHTSFNYNTSTSYLVGYYHNATNTARQYYANTRPTKGTGGVWLKITGSNPSTVYSSCLFPYQTSIPDFYFSVPAGYTRYFRIMPNTPDQLVKGKMYWSYQS